jgi:hypothetical protein
MAGDKIWLMEHQGLICIKTEGDQQNIQEMT